VAEALNALEQWKDHSVPRRTACGIGASDTRRIFHVQWGMLREATVSVVADEAT
jgi:hypothetical protein